MIPVWRPKPDPDDLEGEQRAMKLMTMLAARLETGGEADVLKGRVVGPAICCTMTGAQGSESALDLDVRPETPGEGWHSLSIT